MDAKTKKILTKLGKEKVELGLIQDILSDVDANDVGVRKARQMIRSAAQNVSESIQIYQRLEKRTAEIKKNTKKLQAEIKTLGIDRGSLDTQTKFAIDGTYLRIAEGQASRVKNLRDAIIALRDTGDL